MEAKEKLFEEIKRIVSLEGVDPDSAIRIFNTVAKTLQDYDVSPRQTAVACIDSDSEMLLKYFIGSFLTEGKSKKSAKGYARTIQMFMRYIDKPLKEVTELDVRGWMADSLNTIQPSTLNTRISELKSFYNWLEYEELIQKSPLKKIKPIKTEKKVKSAINPVDVSALKDFCITLRERAELEFLLSTGVRVDELCQMDRSDVNIATREVIVRHGKGNKQRIVYITDVCAYHLAKYLESRKDSNPCLFYTRNNHRISPNTIRNDLKKMEKRANLSTHVHPHRCRRTMATELHHKAVDVATIQNLLGHSDISTTMIYIQQDQSAVKTEYMYKYN